MDRRFESSRLRQMSRVYVGLLLNPHKFPQFSPHNCYSSNRSRTKGRFFNLSSGAVIAVLRWRSSSTEADSKSLTRWSSCSFDSASLDAGITVPSSLKLLKGLGFHFPAYSTLLRASPAKKGIPLADFLESRPHCIPTPHDWPHWFGRLYTQISSKGLPSFAIPIFKTHRMNF